MRELSKRLAIIKKDAGESRLKEAKVLISKLHAMNMRWNIAPLSEFLTQRQKELFY
jgi:hypothetical protein